MMKPCIAALAGLTLAACSGTQEASAPTPQLSDMERLVAAIEANGCTISPANAGPIQAQASLASGALASLLTEMESAGRLAPDGADTLRLSSNNCI